MKESELLFNIDCRLLRVKNRVIFLAKFNVRERGFFLLEVRLNGTSIFLSLLAFDPILHLVPYVLLKSSHTLYHFYCCSTSDSVKR